MDWSKSEDGRGVPAKKNLPMPKSVCALVEHRKLETNGLSIGPPYLYLSLLGNVGGYALGCNPLG